MSFWVSMFTSISVCSILMERFVPRRKPGQKWGAANWLWTVMFVLLFFGLMQFIQTFLSFLVVNASPLADHHLIMRIHAIAAFVAIPIAILHGIHRNTRMVAANPDSKPSFRIPFHTIYSLGILLGYYELVKIILVFLLTNTTA